MASTSGGISGTAVAVSALGAVLVYAGFRNVNPIQALRDAAGGKPPPVESRTTAPPATSTPSLPSGLGDPKRAQVVAAAQKYVGDIYSQARRTTPGYSDCSSFVDKCLKDAGIAPPFSPWANTSNYRMSPEWKTIPANQAMPGDIGLSAGHMVLITSQGGANGIGQQRPGVNVKTGSMQVLFGSQSFVYKTYTKYGASGSVGGGGGGGGGSW